MNQIDKIKSIILSKINKTLGGGLLQTSLFEYPPSSSMGDLSLPCFAIAKGVGKNPAQIAEELVGILQGVDFIEGVKTAGPYLNITLDKAKIAKELFAQINKEGNKFGLNKTGSKKRVMIEYSNANTHKEYHIGHLRNLFYGDAVSKILSANGAKAIPVSYINDFGIHIAKTIWALNEYYKKGLQPANRGRFLGEVYARASKELKENQIGAQLVGGIMKKIESKKGSEYKQWQETRQWSIEQFAEIYKELDIEFKHIFYESEFIDEGFKLVNKLLEKGVYEKSQGAVIANFEEENLGVLVVLRSDGTALYPVADIPLAINKLKKFKIDESIYVVDKAQSLYFKQLFNILKKLGYKQNMVHLGYDVVKLPSGKMSSRLGNVISYEDLKEQALEKAIKETRKRHSDWSEIKIERTAWSIVKATLKFEMLKVNQNQIITFDTERALSFSGYTASYVLYTFARINSILKKQKTVNRKFSLENIADIEKNIIIKLAKYPEIVEKAGSSFDPSDIAKYLFELCQITNDFYHSLPVLKADENERKTRLNLLITISQIIKNGLEILGVETIAEM